MIWYERSWKDFPFHTLQVCACMTPTGDDRIVINGSSCNSSLITPPSTGPESRVNTVNAVMTQIGDVMRTTELQTEPTCIKSCPTVQCPPLERTTPESPSYRNIQIDVLKNRTNSVESCLVCQPLICPLTQEHQSLTYHVFNSIFVAILALLLGFMLGYIFQKYRLKYPNSK